MEFANSKTSLKQQKKISKNYKTTNEAIHINNNPQENIPYYLTLNLIMKKKRTIPNIKNKACLIK